jgi:hypothetical protein
MNGKSLFFLVMFLLTGQPGPCFAEKAQTENSLIGITQNVARMGVLNILVYPQECTVVLNKKTLGTGDQWVDSLPGGYYAISVEHEGKSKADSVFVQPGKVTTVEFSLKRKVRFQGESKYLLARVHGVYVGGLQIGIGAQYGKNIFLFEITASTNPLEKSAFEASVGGIALLKWSYSYNISNMVTIAPGISAGLWTTITSVLDNYERIAEEYRDIYFGGPNIRVFIEGGGILKFVADYTLLIGSSTVNVVGLGISITL